MARATAYQKSHGRTLSDTAVSTLLEGGEGTLSNSSLSSSSAGKRKFANEDNEDIIIDTLHAIWQKAVEHLKVHSNLHVVHLLDSSSFKQKVLAFCTPPTSSSDHSNTDDDVKKRICTLFIETDANKSLLNAFTTNSVCKSDNFDPVPFLHLRPENLAFGCGKSLIELEEWNRLLDAIDQLHDDIASLDSVVIVVVGYFRRLCSKDYVRDDAARQANEEIARSFNEAIAVQDFDTAKRVANALVKSQLVANMPVLLTNLLKTLNKNADECKDDAAHSIKAKLQEITDAAAQAATDDSTMSAKDFFHTYYAESRRILLRVAHLVHPKIAKLVLGASAYYIIYAEKWEKLCMDTEYPIAIWAVAFIRLCLLINSNDATVLIFYLFNAFGKQSEFSAGFKPTNKRADNLWANAIEVTDEKFGPLCDCVTEGADDQIANVIRLITEGKEKQLACANRLSLELLKLHLFGQCALSDATLKAANTAKNYLASIGFDKLSFVSSSSPQHPPQPSTTTTTTTTTITTTTILLDIFNLRPIDDDVKAAFKAITSDHARSFIKELHDCLPTIVSTSQLTQKEKKAAAAKAAAAKEEEDVVMTDAA